MSFAVTLRAPSILSAVCCSTVTERWKNFPLDHKRRQNATICVTLIPVEARDLQRHLCSHASGRNVIGP